MNALSPDVRMKLARVLGLLGSNHPGERDAAGLAADRIVRGAGLSWEDLLGPAPRPSSRPAYRSSPGSSPASETAFRTDVQMCLRHCRALTDWERGFLATVVRRFTVSEAQASKMRQIADRLRMRGLT